MSYRASAAAKHEPSDRSGYQPCRACFGSTPLAMLAQYGAMCRECFDRYCRGVSDRPAPRTRAERVEVLEGLRGIGQSDAQAWAHSEHQGATLAQRDMVERARARLAPAPSNFALPPALPLPGAGEVPSLPSPPVDAYTSDAP